MNFIKTNKTVEEVEAETIVLKNLTFAMSYYLGDYAVSKTRMKIENIIPYDGIAFRFSTKIMGKEKHKTYHRTVKLPATWWQQFKLEKFPDFLLKRFPVKTKRKKFYFKFNHMALFPKLNRIPPNEELRVSYLTEPMAKLRGEA